MRYDPDAEAGFYKAKGEIEKFGPSYDRCLRVATHLLTMHRPKEAIDMSRQAESLRVGGSAGDTLAVEAVAWLLTAAILLDEDVQSEPSEELPTDSAEDAMRFAEIAAMSAGGLPEVADIVAEARAQIDAGWRPEALGRVCKELIMS